MDFPIKMPMSVGIFYWLIIDVGEPKPPLVVGCGRVVKENRLSETGSNTLLWPLQKFLPPDNYSVSVSALPSIIDEF